MPRYHRFLIPATVALTGLNACEPAGHDPDLFHDPVCAPPAVSVDLPDEIQETSGVAVSRRHPGIFWTHNDSGWPAKLFAIDSAGIIRATIRVDGASNRDWEDIELAPCLPRSPNDCLFIGDIGDNEEQHHSIIVYRIPEPDPRSDTVTAPATVIRAAYQEGPRDAEALFVTDLGIHIVNKGRAHAVEMFLIPPPYTQHELHDLRTRQRIAPPPTSASSHVTAGAAEQGTGRVALRTYGGLLFFRLEADTLARVGEAAEIIVPGQRLGEAVDFLGGDRFILTSEGSGPHPPHLAILSCDPAPDGWRGMADARITPEMTGR